MITAVIFDIDGVLLDSFESNLEFYERLFETLGHTPPSRDFLRENHHMSIWEMITAITGVTDEATKKEMMKEAYKLDYQTEYPLKLTEGAAEVISTLASEYKLGIASSRQSYALFEGELADCKELFSCAVGFEDTKNHKPHPEPLLCVAEGLQVKPEECVYIGDMPTDIEAASKAGMYSIHFTDSPDERATFHTGDFSVIPDLVRQLSTKGVD